MFRGGLDGLDGFLHGADTLVVEFATGKLPVLDFGVEAGNQFPQRWDLRLGGGTVAGDHFHDFARAALAAMPALGFRQTDRGRDPFFEMISGQCRQTRHANRIVEHGVRRAWALDGSEDHRSKGDDVSFAQLVLEEILKRGARHAVWIHRDGADGIVAQLGINFGKFVFQGAGEDGSGQLPVRDLHRVLPTDRPRGFRRRHERLEDAFEGRLGGFIHFPNGFGSLVADTAIRVVELFDQDGKCLRRVDEPQCLAGTWI